ncbi:hypothetical protein [Pontimicrobium sp. MEBiC01747]|jgi:hypothetical protein
MKKLVLVLAIVFISSSSFVNANSSDSTLLYGDCTASAWNFGTDYGDGNEADEYFWTNLYFEAYCNDDGSFFKEGVNGGY